jgi:hypothetical protein
MSRTRVDAGRLWLAFPLPRQTISRLTVTD